MAATLALLAGCTDVLGIEPLREGDAPVELGEPCGSCVAATCADAERRCAADPLCAELAACSASAVNDPAGRAACRTEQAAAASLASWEALDACLRNGCQDACTGITGLFRAHGEDCDACVVEACPEQASACVGDGACERAVISAFDDEPMTPPKILSLYTDVADAVATCTNEPCGVACGRNDVSYECLGAFDWPQPDESLTEAEIYVETRITNGVTTPLLAGVEVESCSPLALPCDGLSRGVSDEDGRMTLRVPVATSTGFRGWFEAFTTPPLEEVMVEHIFSGRPQYAPSRGQVLVLTPQTFDFTLSLAETTRVEGRAHAVVVFLDCAGNTSPGVTLGHDEGLLVDAASRIFYPIDGEGPTEDSGWVFLLDVQPGCVEVSGSRDGAETHRGRFIAAPDVLNVLFLFPSTSGGDVGHVCN
jgi:hypothetical protein